MISFSPGYYHNVVSSSTSNPVFCTSLFLDQKFTSLLTRSELPRRPGSQPFCCPGARDAHSVQRQGASLVSSRQLRGQAIRLPVSASLAAHARLTHDLFAHLPHRGAINIKAGAIIGHGGGAGGFGPGGIDVAHEDWGGTLIVEVDGTTEHATLVIARVRPPLAFVSRAAHANSHPCWAEQISSIEPTPYRILREKSRPGKLWLR
jgi:hypothetical protein